MPAPDPNCAPALPGERLDLIEEQIRDIFTKECSSVDAREEELKKVTEEVSRLEKKIDQQRYLTEKSIAISIILTAVLITVVILSAIAQLVMEKKNQSTRFK